MFKKKNKKLKSTYNNLDNIYTYNDYRLKHFEKYDRETLEHECLNQMNSQDRLITIIENQRSDLMTYVNYYNTEIEKLIDYYNAEITELNNRVEYYKSKYEDLQMLENITDYYLCNICYVNPKNLILNPCNHFSMCDKCYINLSKQIQNRSNGDNGNNGDNVYCPMCRKKVDNVINIFY
jgi:hypothetical protein